MGTKKNVRYRYIYMPCDASNIVMPPDGVNGLRCGGGSNTETSAETCNSRWPGGTEPIVDTLLPNLCTYDINGVTCSVDENQATSYGIRDPGTNVLCNLNDDSDGCVATLASQAVIESDIDHCELTPSSDFGVTTGTCRPAPSRPSGALTFPAGANYTCHLVAGTWSHTLDAGELCNFTCQTGYDITGNQPTCGLSGVAGMIDGDLACTEVECTQPTDQAYNYSAVTATDGSSTAVMGWNTFDVAGLTCDRGYEESTTGTAPVATTCGTPGGTDYMVDGCDPVICDDPSTPGYDLTSLSQGDKGFLAFNVGGIACAANYEQAPGVAPTATACLATGGEYNVEGCYPTCPLPGQDPPGYVINPTTCFSAEDRTSLGGCSATCAPGYTGAAVVTCTAPGGSLTLKGCTRDIQGSLENESKKSDFQNDYDGTIDISWKNILGGLFFLFIFVAIMGFVKKKHT
jgi:hypothetical protein